MESADDRQTRLEAFEQMLSDLLAQSRFEREQLDLLKAQGKEKTATYQLFMGNRLLLNRILDLYKKYDLLQ